mmetsp:Transcript_5287/g.22468  ORF Transcript_5287/g.22468 Transcript_5287/m.22468 type:complete len:93 (-) Transcript_5287:1697-1975(-)
MMLFMSHFSDLYPCEVCQSGLKDIVSRTPPEVESNKTFTQWMCKVHNGVNEHLGKELFDCSKVRRTSKPFPISPVLESILASSCALFRRRGP